MARAAIRRRLNWTLGEVVELIDETPRVRSIVLDVPEWPGHRAGQHVDVRLTAEDGYQAQRSYSIASAPGGRTPRAHRGGAPGRRGVVVPRRRAAPRRHARAARAGRRLLRWEADIGRAAPAGRRRLRHRPVDVDVAPSRCSGAAVGARARVLVSRSWEDVIYRDELERLASATNGPEVDPHADAIPAAGMDRLRSPGRRCRCSPRSRGRLPAWRSAFVCGPTPFVESVAAALVLLGYPATSVKTERFGPTGG